MMVYYSIYESIIGVQADECDGFICPKCGKEITKHRGLSEVDWNRNRLVEIINNVDLVEEYLSVILTVRDKIRHKTVHAGLHPTAKHIMQKETKMEYDINKSAKEFKDDRTALLSLKLNMKDVARSLLLNKIFGFVFFPHIGKVVSHTIHLHTKSNAK